MNAYLFLRNRLNKDKSATVYIRIIVNRQKKDISTKIKVNPEFWDDNKKQLNCRTEKCRKINLALRDFKRRISDIIINAQLYQENLTIETFAERILNRKPQKFKHNFPDYILKKNVGYANTTAYNIRFFAGKLRNYQDPIFIEDITENGY